tara:strand:+ start:69 stop:641 length:573 start_codon:yes stop_codon:yes gene_type:complete
MDQDLTQLYSPVPAPGTPTLTPGTPAPVTPGFSYSGGFTPANQAMMGNLSGANPQALQPSMPVGSGNTMYQGPMFGQEDIGNVGGVVGMNEETLEAYIPPDNTEQQTTDFHDAAAGEGDYKMYNTKGEQVTGRKAARGAKRADRQADRAARKEAGLKGGEKRRKRRAQRKERKDSWKDYKADEAAIATEF